ncbi:hypothetical protein QBC36DRAFT_292479 [Triangularia setosa]|uniref:Uncharacterized protein n=1 Tax=Triangularia setosa TaxID=2587417 RepID=A0AAN6W3R4_9PEZI|nr:hypothetical protein QBC36DRAFT_292479 [Podospora setosa]
MSALTSPPESLPDNVLVGEQAYAEDVKSLGTVASVEHTEVKEVMDESSSPRVTDRECNKVGDSGGKTRQHIETRENKPGITSNEDVAGPNEAMIATKRAKGFGDSPHQFDDKETEHKDTPSARETSHDESVACKSHHERTRRPRYRNTESRSAPSTAERPVNEAALDNAEKKAQQEVLNLKRKLARKDREWKIMKDMADEIRRLRRAELTWKVKQSTNKPEMSINSQNQDGPQPGKEGLSEDSDAEEAKPQPRAEMN